MSNTLRIIGICELPLTQGKVALVDKKDFIVINKWKWFYSKGYAARSQYISLGKYKYTTKVIFLHRVILNTPKGLFTDHINGNKLDNRRQNLRIVTKSQNGQNKKKTNIVTSSKFKGVTWFKRDRIWRAGIKVNKKFYHIGYFKNERHAAMAYDMWAKDLFGKFAKFNF